MRRSTSFILSSRQLHSAARMNACYRGVIEHGIVVAINVKIDTFANEENKNREGGGRMVAFDLASN